MSRPLSTRIGATEYGELVASVQAVVAAAVPVGARALVLSKGDPALVEIAGVHAWHFPQDAAGKYAGYHPRDSEDAIAHMEQLRRCGAEYLVIPTTSRWWLDHYAGLAEHLANNARLVTDDAASCRIYDLGRRGGTGVIGRLSDAAPQIPIAQMRDYLEHLLPTDSRVLVLETLPGLAAGLAPVQAQPLAPHELLGGGAGPLALLRRLAASGAEYLVVPRDGEVWLRRHAELDAEIEAVARRIADQRHLCRVFSLEAL